MILRRRPITSVWLLAIMCLAFEDDWNKDNIQRNCWFIHAFVRMMRTKNNVIHFNRFSPVTMKNESRDQGDDENEDRVVPQLPALTAGSSSSLMSSSSLLNDVEPVADLNRDTSSGRFGNSTSSAAFVSSKFELQYTCNVCETRNRVLINRQAYREGMVIAICKGCDAKHWIADNLDPTLTSNNIEELFANNANNTMGNNDEESYQPQRVTRVTREVYEIERVWEFQPGQITDNQGNPVLE